MIVVNAEQKCDEKEHNLMTKNSEALYSTLPDSLPDLKIRAEMPVHDMFVTLARLAGDVDRYLQYLDSGRTGEAEYELSNVRLRIMALKDLEKELEGE